MINTFDGQLVQDLPESRVPNDSWTFAMNAVIKNRRKSNFGLANEPSVDLIKEGVKDVVGSLYLDHINSTLIIQKDGIFSLFNHDKKELKEVFKQSEFSCNFNLGNCEYHDIAYQVNKDTFIYFSSQNIYYWFNLDEMLNPQRKEGLKKALSCEGCYTGCDYFKIFLPTCGIKINAARQKNGASGIAVGSYMFFARYVNKNGGWTNWSLPSNRVNVTSRRNLPGEKSNDSVVVKLSGLDCKFNKIQVAVIQSIAGGFSSGILNTMSYKGDKLSFEFTGQDTSPIDVIELLVSDQTMIKGRNLTINDSTMYYYNIQSQQEYNVQRIADKIKTKVAVYTVPYSLVKQYDLKSLMGGETYALGIWLNRVDGTRTYAGHIPPQPSSGGSTAASTTDSTSGSMKIDFTPRSLTNTRSASSTDLTDRSTGGEGSDSTNDPESAYKDWETTLADICENLKPGCEGLTEDMFFSNGELNCDCGDAVDVYCESKEKKKQAEQCFKDIQKLNKILASFGNEYADYGVDIIPSSYSASSIKAAGLRILDAIKNRERFERKESTFSVTYTEVPKYLSQTLNNFTKEIGDFTTAADSQKDFSIQYYKSATINTIPKVEQNILYPCNTDCKGQFIYSKHGQPVAHHKIVDRSVIPHFYSTSHGVKGKFNVEDPTEDLYVNLLGLEFTGIVIPSDKDLGFEVCKNNPYTIGIVPITKSNRTVDSKGIAFSTFIISNGGKEYEQQRYGANSLEEVSRYHNGTGDHKRLSNLGHGDTHVVYSLDHLTGNNVNASQIKTELLLTGQGERFGLWAKGKEPEDSVKGARLDQRGTRQHIYFSKSSSVNTVGTIDFIEEANANKVISSINHKRPLNNLSQQKSLWVKSSALAKRTDSSFTGDVLTHNAVIPQALGDYVSFLTPRPNQYGLLDNLMYQPALYGTGSSVEGLVGDVYVGLWSFVRTGYVSDKVGSGDNKFNIPSQVPIKKEKRSICDCPEDFIFEDLGVYTWTDLPEEGDASDAKNWAGTHTIIGSRTQPYTEAVGKKAISGYYIPKTVKTLITVPIESYSCPWLLISGNDLDEQVPMDIDNKYTIDSGSTFDQDTAGWDKSYLNNYIHYVHRQPSTWRKLVKVLFRFALTVWFPTWIGAETLEILNGLDAVSALAKFPFLYPIYKLLKDNLLSNRVIDKMLGIPVCKTDEVGGEDESFLRNERVENYLRNNLDFSNNDKIVNVEGIPFNFTDCVHNDFNIIYYSDKQNSFSLYDSLRHVRPNSRFEIPVEFGKVTNLFNVRGDFYAHTTDHIIPLRYNNVTMSSDIGDIIVGTPNKIDGTTSLAGDIREGYAGLRNKWLAKNTVLGYVFTDIDSGRIYLFEGKSPQELNQGMSIFLKEHTEFCTQQTCMYERLEGVPHYDFAYDWLLDRLLITKVDGKYSWTLSYYVERKGYVSFHSYTPQIYLSDRKRTFRLEEGTLYQQNALQGCRKCYGGDKDCSPFIVEFVIKQPEGVTHENLFFKGFSVNLDTYQHKGGRNWVADQDSFFNKISWYNTTQGSGTLNVNLIKDNMATVPDAINQIKENPKEIVVTKQQRNYFVKRLNDYKDQVCVNDYLVKQDICEPYCQINESVFQDSAQLNKNFIGRSLTDTHLTVRLTKDDEDDMEYNLISVRSIIDKPQRRNGW